MGYRGIQNGLLRFHDVKLPKESLLWQEGRGLKLAFVTLNTGRLTLPATNTAVARECLQIVRRWASRREQWGEAIGRHEAVSSKLGWIASHVFAMESFCDYASALADRGESDIRIEAAMAKLFCSEIGFRVVDETIQVRGGRGYEKVHSLVARGESPDPVERLFREARLNTIVEGSSEILRLFLAREALDPHFQRAGALLDPEASFVAKAAAAVRFGVYYTGWWFSRLLPRFGKTPADMPAALRGHWRWIERTSRGLARRILYAMLRFGPGLEHRQVLLGRLVDEGVELTAVAVTCARAASRGDGASVELADLFCRHARVRVAAARRRPARLDRAGREVAEHVLQGRYRSLEEGILPHVPEDATSP
jgi:hypothetical protein